MAKKATRLMREATFRWSSGGRKASRASWTWPAAWRARPWRGRWGSGSRCSAARRIIDSRSPRDRRSMCYEALLREFARKSGYQSRAVSGNGGVDPESV